VLDAHPAVTLVNEPDNAEVAPLAEWATARHGSAPSLKPGERAPEYDALFAAAFRARVPVRGRRLRAARRLHWPALSGRVPDHVSGDGVVLVKSVAAYCSLEWFQARFDPRMIVLWRHPLNVLASWLEIGWRGAQFAAGQRALCERFERTALWPPPSDPVTGLEWAVCASTVVVLESAARTRAVVRAHEDNAREPAAAIAAMLDHLGLAWTGAIDTALADHDRPGNGWTAQRVAGDEPQRWRTRLDAAVVAEMTVWLDRFGDESPIAAAAWSTSPAVHDG
jgi:hypothetical protein